MMDKKKNSIPLVGIIGTLNSGKGALAQSFVDRGFVLRSFADPVKEAVHFIFGIPKEILWGPSENRTGTIRQMLQELGTDYARKFRPTVWVDKMEQFILEQPPTTSGIIIPDVRFVNEAEMLVRNGAVLIRIFRDGCGDHESVRATQHESETENEKIPHNWVRFTVNNSGTLDELRSAGASIIKELL